MICAVRRVDGPPLPGFTKVADRSHHRQVPLHLVLAKGHPALGRPFEPGKIFHHVGARLCARPAEGWREQCWVRTADLGSAEPAEAPLLARVWITAGGIGYLPVIGATMASAVTAALASGLGLAMAWDEVRLLMAAVVAIATIASVLVERPAARHFLTDDPREFVLDEVAGMAAALLFVPAAGWPWGVGVALVAFRFFDVLKPGIEWVERAAWRGTIVWDDLLAGLYAGACTWGIVAGARHFLP